MKKKKEIIEAPKLTPKQLLIQEIVDVMEKHECVIELTEFDVRVINKTSPREWEGPLYERIIHTLKCEL